MCLQATYTILLVPCVQRNDYDAALVAAFRREQEKEAQLKAMIDAKQIAEQLVCSSSWFCISTFKALKAKIYTDSHVFADFNILFLHRQLKRQKR